MKKKAAKKLKSKASTPREPEVLTRLEAMTLEKYALCRETLSNKRLVLQLREALLTEKQENYRLMSKCLEIEKPIFQKERDTIKDQWESLNKETAVLQEEIRSRLNIKGKFGHDPETLEVIRVDGE